MQELNTVAAALHENRCQPRTAEVHEFGRDPGGRLFSVTVEAEFDHLPHCSGSHVRHQRVQFLAGHLQRQSPELNISARYPRQEPVGVTDRAEAQLDDVSRQQHQEWWPVELAAHGIVQDTNVSCDEPLGENVEPDVVSKSQEALPWQRRWSSTESGNRS